MRSFAGEIGPAGSSEDSPVHMQIRCHPVKSPPDIERLLDVLAAGGVNLIAVGGSDVEFGGQFAFVPEDGQEDLALSILKGEGYRHEAIHANDEEDPRVRYEDIPDGRGSLHRFVMDVSRENLEAGRIIRDVLIGVQSDAQREARVVPVHVYSEPIRSPKNVVARS
jgi:hypothetical protein